MAAGATLAVTATQLANATDYIQQLQGLLKATEAALDTANKLNVTGGRLFTLFKPVLTARAHYKDALAIYSVAVETITPCIGDMKRDEALDFLESATRFLDFRKSIYEGESYKRQECIRLRKQAIILKENADRSRAKMGVDKLHNIVMNKPTTTHDAPRAGNVAPPPVVHTSVATAHDAVWLDTTSRNPFVDARYTATATTDPNISDLSVQASA